MSSSYAEAYPEYVPDTRHRGRVSIAHVLPPSRDISRRGGFSVDLVFSSILGKSVLALGLHLTKEWLLASGSNSAFQDARISVGEAHWRLLAIAAVFLAIWHRPWELFNKRINYTRLLSYSALVCAESFAYMTALDKLPVLRLVMLSEASQLWTHGLQSMRRKGSSTARNANFVAVATIGISYVAELYLNKRIPKTSVNTGYLAVIAYLALKATAIDTLRSLSPTGGPQDDETQARYHSLGLVISIPIALFFSIIPTSSKSSIEASSPLPVQTTLTTLALLAFALFVADPVLNKAVNRRTVTIKGFKGIWPISVLSVAFIGVTAFERTLQITDFVIGAIAYWGISYILHSDPRLVAEAAGRGVSSFVNGHVATSRKGKETVLDSLERQYRQLRATIKTILENPDSKKIYYFLCLNLAFMFVQMMYGIWTNSLGLISDSIHMFFDCLALAMGLLASVMATWPRNETFTYGYVRVETLSGFANGVFLVLISIFIVFEAIQRLIDPPEMNTNQLLTVSVLGLAVNLVGMFATGHHHHGHSHGHDHSGHDHSHGHSHGHSHNMHGVFLHVMADTLGSVGVIVSTLLINRYGWTGFDPIASIFIAVLIFASVIPLILDSAQLLCLDLGSDREKAVRGALAKLSSVEGLSSYGAARFWPKDPSTVVGSIHIQLAPSPSHDHRGPSNGANGNAQVGFSHYANAEKVVKRVESVLKGAIDGLVELSVQVEPSEGDISCPCMVTVPSWSNGSL